jgi:hypothetical protein
MLREVPGGNGTVPFWIASVAKISGLPIFEVLKLATNSFVAVRRQSCCMMGVFCKTKSPVDATVSNLINSEPIMAMVTGQCDVRID